MPCTPVPGGVADEHRYALGTGVVHGSSRIVGPTIAANNVAPPTMRASAVALHTFVTHAVGDALAPALLGALGDAVSLPYALALNAGAIALSGAIFLLGRRSLRADLGPALPPALPQP